jgi:GMP synthase-like glutamine amidotransferase
MRPVVIFRFSPGDDPGRFAEWLDAAKRPWRLVSLHDGERVPSDPRAFAGIGMMGGPMSVNDALAWVAPMEALVRQAVDERIPVIGHCLGGQLLAKALGAPVRRVAQPEIGWIEVTACSPQAGDWFAGRERFTTFEWHYEGFDLPAGAEHLLSNAFNANQAFAVDDRHIGFQGHIEMTTSIVRHWVAVSGDELPSQSTPSMQSAADILRGLDERVGALNRVADAVYARWARGLAD